MISIFNNDISKVSFLQALGAAFLGLVLFSMASAALSFVYTQSGHTSASSFIGYADGDGGGGDGGGGDGGGGDGGGGDGGGGDGGGDGGGGDGGGGDGGGGGDSGGGDSGGAGDSGGGDSGGSDDAGGGDASSDSGGDADGEGSCCGADSSDDGDADGEGSCCGDGESDGDDGDDGEGEEGCCDEGPPGPPGDNTPPPPPPPPPGKGCLVINKDAFDAKGKELHPTPYFTFKIDGHIIVTTDSSGFARVDNLSLGSHSVSEVVPSGWVLTSVSPSSGIVHVTAGSNCVKITFKNKQEKKEKPACVIKAKPDHIVIFEDPELSWTSTNATSASLNQGIGAVSVNGVYHVFPEVTTTYTLTVTGPGGSAQCSVTVTVTTISEGPGPSCDIWASPESIEMGDSATIGWSSEEAETAWMSNIGDVDVEGEINLSPQETTTYTVHVSNDFGDDECSLTIVVEDGPPDTDEDEPFCDIWANPTHIFSWEDSTISWSSEHADTASLSSVGNVSVDGSRDVSPDVTKTYTLTVYNDTGSSQCSVTIFVDQEDEDEDTDPSCWIDANPGSINEGEGTTLTWDADNASSASLSSVGTVSLSGSRWISNLYSSKTYTLTVWDNDGDSAQCQTTVVVDHEDENGDEDPSCWIHSNPSSINEGESAYLTWNSSDASWASLSSVGSVSANGNYTVYPQYTTTYTLTVYGNNGESAQCQTVVYVDQDYHGGDDYDYDRPSCSISISNYGYWYDHDNQATLTWWSNKATSAYITPSIGSVSTNGSRTIYPGHNTVYTMTVYGPGGSATCHTVIKNVHVPIPPVPPIYPDYPMYPNHPFVSLTQIPYTGFDFGPIGNSLFWVALLALALGSTYFAFNYMPQFAGGRFVPLRGGMRGALQTQYLAFANVAEVAASPIRRFVSRG